MLLSSWYDVMVETNKKIRVLIVEDSDMASYGISSIINAESDMEVIGIAKDGKKGIEYAKKFQPDIITMDIRMPQLDGLEATKIIMETDPKPIIILSYYLDDKSLDVTFQALQYGAVGVLEKPNFSIETEYERVRVELLTLIRAMYGIKLIKRRPNIKSQVPQPIAKKFSNESKYKIIALAASTGGPVAFRQILAALPENFPVPIVMVQHMANSFLWNFVKWLSESVKLTVKIANNHELLRPRTVYVAPEDNHLLIRKTNSHLITELSHASSLSRFMPSANELLKSVAQACPESAIGGVLTGMGDDGADGLLEMKNAGCSTFVESEETAVIFGMPRCALENKAAIRSLPLHLIAEHLILLVSITR